MREMKDSGVEWIGTIPVNHSLLRNKYLFEYVKGKIPNSTNTDQIGYPYIGASDLDTYEEYNTFTTDENIPSCRYDDLLVLWDGARAGLCGTHKVGKISSTIVRLRAKASYHPSYLYWYYKGFESFMYQLVNGTTIPHMNRRYIEQIGWIDWSLKEQEKISTYLNAKCSQIDAIITREQAVIEKLKEYKSSVITEAVTKGLNPEAPMKDSGYEFIGKIPATWRVLQLRYVGKCQNGISKSGEFFGTGFPFVSYSDVYKNYELPVTTSGLIESSESERKNYSVQKGDIFFTRTSETIEEVGLTAVCMKSIEKATFAGFLIRVRPNKDIIIPLFSKYYFRNKHHRQFIVKEMNLVTRASLGQELLKRLPVLLPPLHEQQEISTYLENKCVAIDQSISKKQVVIDKLAEYKKSLIYEVVTGKTEV